MLTTGFKTYAAWATVLVLAAIVFGYTTGGSGVGPVSLGWKGAVGNHVGYSILLFGGAVMGAVAGMIVAFRDADASAAASYMGLAEAPVAQRPVQPTMWPIVAAFGIALVAIGLVVSEVLFTIGMVLLLVAAIEWTMTAWADAATGDPATNKELRDRIMGPIEIPILGTAAIAIVVVAVSRIFLAVSAEAAVWIAMGVAGLIFGLAILFAYKPDLPKNLVVAVVLILGVALLAAGIIAGAAGERDFHHEEEHHSEAGAEEAEQSEAESVGSGAGEGAEETE